MRDFSDQTSLLKNAGVRLQLFRYIQYIYSCKLKAKNVYIEFPTFL